MTASVIVIEDDRAICDLLTLMLKGEGMVVRCAHSLREFQAMEGSSSADVYIVDISLPDGSGFDLVRALRALKRSGIIVLSGRTDETDSVLGLELGADDYIFKPFRRRELVARVHAVYRRYHGEAGRDASQDAAVDHAFDQYKLNVGARRLWAKDGTEIHLTSSEFDLLVALLSSRGKVLNRDQLMNAMKGRDWSVFDRSVDNLVSRLRKKLPPERGVSHFIKTIHGIGYHITT